MLWVNEYPQHMLSCKNNKTFSRYPLLPGVMCFLLGVLFQNRKKKFALADGIIIRNHLSFLFLCCHLKYGTLCALATDK